MRIPLAKPDLSNLEEIYALNAIRSSWISSTGKYVEAFEEQFAQLCGVSTSIAVCNGTAALHLALLALDLQPGDEVLLPSLTYIATANAVRYLNASPVFVDVDEATWCIDPNLLEENLSDRARGIIAVHLYGHPADMDRIHQKARAHGLWVVEDAAEAHTAKYKGQPVGSLATIGTFSFYGNKIFTAGEGGAITLNDPYLEDRIRMLRGQGMDPGRRYFFPVVGYNYRITNLACAILCAQLDRSEEILSSRRRVFSQYENALSEIPGIRFQPRADWAEPAPWLFSIIVDQTAYGHSRDELMNHLAANGIETRPFFLPLHRLPPYEDEAHERAGDLPITTMLSDQGINLPTYSELQESQIEEIAELIRHRVT